MFEEEMKKSNTATSITWTRTLKTWSLKTWTQKNLDAGKPGHWKTWETAGYGKMIRRTLIITYLD